MSRVGERNYAELPPRLTLYQPVPAITKPSAIKLEHFMKNSLRTLPLALTALALCAPLGAAREDAVADDAGIRLQPGLIICADVTFSEHFWDRARQVSPRTVPTRVDWTSGLLAQLAPILEPRFKGKHLRPGQPAISGGPATPNSTYCSREESVLEVKVIYSLDEPASLLVINYAIRQGDVHMESRRVLNREDIWKSGRYVSGYGRDPWEHTLSRDMEVSAQYIADLILDGQ
jgi:hypothetical protein